MTDGPGWTSPDPRPEPGYGYQPPPPAPPPRQAAKPGVIPLRPLGVGEMLDGAISTMRAHPKPMLGVSAIVVAISQLLILAATYPFLDDLERVPQIDQKTPLNEIYSYLGMVMAVNGIILLITLLSRVFLAGFLTTVVGKAVLGQPTRFGEVWSRVRPRLLALLGLTLIYPAVAIAAAVVIFGLALASAGLAILVAIGLIPLAIWLYILFSLATPVLMLESATVGRAFGRSRQLVRGMWWRVFGILLLGLVITTIFVLILTIPFNIFSGGFDQITTGEPVAPSAGTLALSTIGAIIAGTLAEPFYAALVVLLYTDQRMRREGMDIELARMAGLPPTP